MSNYEGNKKSYNKNQNFNNKKKGNSNNRNSAVNNNKAERDAKRAEIIAKQTKNIDMIESVVEFLDNQLRNDNTNGNDATNTKFSMQKIIDYLTTSKGYAQEDTRIISQFNYMIMDLANAQRSSYINGNRINIRILYIQERLKTSFKKELYTKIDDIINKYNALFYWWNQAESTETENNGIEIIVNDEKETPAVAETVAAPTEG